MRLKSILFSVLILLGGCQKIPERGPVELQLTSVNGSPVTPNEEIIISYDSEVELGFSYATEAGVDEFYAKYSQSIFQDPGTSDTERITDEPQPGELSGEFTYLVTPSEQGEPPVGNSVADRRVLQVVLIDKLGAVNELITPILIQ